MSKLKQLILIIGILFLSGYSYGQFDQDLCKRITNDKVDIKSCYSVAVVTDVEGTSANRVTFSSETVKFNFQAKYVEVKDETGKFIYFTYDKIKAINYSPSTRNYESFFYIYLKD